MAKPPKDWETEARSQLTKISDRLIQLTNVANLIIDALRGHNYKAYQEASAWLNAEEREPNE